MDNKSLPDDDTGLGKLIAAAFDRLPEPAAARLKAIEDRLAIARPRRETRPRPAGWYWWLIFGLAASAAAAWWAGEFFIRESSNQGSAQHAPVSGDAPEQGSVAPKSAQERRDESSNAGSTRGTTNSPAIYRREEN